METGNEIPDISPKGKGSVKMLGELRNWRELVAWVAILGTFSVLGVVSDKEGSARQGIEIVCKALSALVWGN